MKKNKIENALRKSPINYFSDLFVMMMVLAWIIVIVIMVIMAIYATVALQDVYIWSEVGTLVAVPLTCGGGIWMVKNSVQHAIAYSKGERAHMDFPKVDVENDICEMEELMTTSEGENSE